jgi:hypothetical protein
MFDGLKGFGYPVDSEEKGEVAVSWFPRIQVYKK